MKRVYDDASDDDGYRVLVDKWWPRGVSKEKAKCDHWAKEITPSTVLRNEFHQNVKSFKDFKKDYLNELNNNGNKEQFLALVKEKLKSGPLTLIYAAKNEEMNHVVVLKEWIEENL